jgi:DNA gyrase subunit A
VAALQVGEESDVMIITEFGKIIRVHANEIREAGRSTQGVRLLRLEDEDKIAAAASILEEVAVANGADGAGAPPAAAPGTKEPEKS